MMTTTTTMMMMMMMMIISINRSYAQGRTGPPVSLALARWAGWSAVQVGRHDKG